MKKPFLLTLVLMVLGYGTTFSEIKAVPHDIRYEIIDIIKNQTLYSLTAQELRLIEGCFLNDTTISIPSLIRLCFSRDRYAKYVTPEIYKAYADKSFSQYSCINLGFLLKDTTDGSGVLVGGIVVRSSANFKDMIRVGDMIVAAGKSQKAMRSLKDVSLKEAIDILQEPGVVVFDVLREGNKIRFVLTCSELNTDLFFHKIDSSVGYLKIKSFNSWDEYTVENDMVPVFDKFLREGVQALIIDLRGNPGGTLEAVLEVLRLIAPKERSMMVELRFGKRQQSESRFTRERGQYADLKIGILVDYSSASGAELVAGVLQLWGHKVFGTRTYGKGSVQEIFPLSNGGAFLTTIAKYYFANGKSPDGVGVMPDVEAHDEIELFKGVIGYLKMELKKN